MRVGIVVALLVGATAVSGMPVATADDPVPPEAPGCSNGFRVRACLHVTIHDLSPVSATPVPTCYFRVQPDFFFDDPLFLTPWAGDFEWSWSDTKGHGDSGEFDGVPLYPVLGLVMPPPVDIELDDGEIYMAFARAWDNQPLTFDDEAEAFFIAVCASV